MIKTLKNSGWFLNFLEDNAELLSLIFRSAKMEPRW